MTLKDLFIVCIVIGVVAVAGYFLHLDNKASKKERDTWYARWDVAEKSFFAYIGRAQLAGSAILKIDYNTYLVDGKIVCMKDFLEDAR